MRNGSSFQADAARPRPYPPAADFPATLYPNEPPKTRVLHYLRECTSGTWVSVAVLPIMIEQSWERRLNPVPLAESPSFRMSRRRQSGFSLIELLVVIAIALVLMAMASPLVMNVINTYHLRTAGGDYANLMQTARMRAVQDDQYYPVWINAGVPPAAPSSNACVDLNANAACDWGVAGAVAEPAVAFHRTVQIQAFQAPVAPNLANLRGQYLPITCGLNGACVDVNPNIWGPTFGPARVELQHNHFNLDSFELKLMRIVIQNRTKKSEQRGFMLIELLISMVVLTVGLGGLLILMISALHTDNRSGGDTSATMVAEHVIEQISAQPANSPNLIPFTDCAGTVWNVNPVGAAIGAAGTGANGGNGADLTPGPTPGGPAGIIDWTQAYAGVPANYKMQWVACGAGGRQTTYDVRWNVISLSTYSQLVVISARPAASAQSGGLRFVMPVNLRTVQGM